MVWPLKNHSTGKAPNGVDINYAEHYQTADNNIKFRTYIYETKYNIQGAEVDKVKYPCSENDIKVSYSYCTPKPSLNISISNITIPASGGNTIFTASNSGGYFEDLKCSIYSSSPWIHSDKSAYMDEPITVSVYENYADFQLEGKITVQLNNSCQDEVKEINVVQKSSPPLPNLKPCLSAIDTDKRVFHYASSSPYAITTNHLENYTFMYNEIGDFNGDGIYEEVFSDGVNLFFYEFSSNAFIKQINVIGMIDDITVGDINNDGIDEIIVFAEKMLRAYRYSDGSTILDYNLEQYFCGESRSSISLTAGYFDDDNIPEFAIGEFGTRMVHFLKQSNEPTVYEYLGRTESASMDQIKNFDISSGDFNGDGIEEVVVLNERSLTFLKYNPELIGENKIQRFPIPFEGRYRRVSTFDCNGDNKDELFLLSADCDKTVFISSFIDFPVSNMLEYINVYDVVYAAGLKDIAAGPLYSSAEFLTVSGELNKSKTYRANSLLETLNITELGNKANVTFISNDKVVLKAGFKAKSTDTNSFKVKINK